MSLPGSGETCFGFPPFGSGSVGDVTSCCVVDVRSTCSWVNCTCWWACDVVAGLRGDVLRFSSLRPWLWMLLDWGQSYSQPGECVGGKKNNKNIDLQLRKTIKMIFEIKKIFMYICMLFIYTFILTFIVDCLLVYY